MHPSGAHVRIEDAIDGVVHFLLAHHRRAALPLLRGGGLIEGPVEELEAAHRTRRLLQRLGAVEVEAVADIVGRVARVHTRSLEERLHVLLEGENGLVLEERAPDLIADALQVAQRVHDSAPPPIECTMIL